MTIQTGQFGDGPADGKYSASAKWAYANLHSHPILRPLLDLENLGSSASQDFPVACLIWVDGTGRAIGEHATASTQGSYVFVTRRPKPLTTSLQVPIHKGSLGLHPSGSWETDATGVGRDHRCLAQSRRLRMAWNGQQKAGIDSLFTLVS